MIVLDDDGLEFHFPEVHEAARCRIDFQRTLRIPDDGGDYPLPPGLGSFPLRHLDDYAARLPDAWRRRGGVIMPMYQAEALWIAFDASYPFAVKVSAGKVCALTGDGWAERLNRDPQDYLVLPDQPWLDGFCVEKGIIRQFVAMPLGEGYTAEEQLTGAAEHGGLQIVAFPMKVERYEALLKDQLRMFEPLLHSCSFAEDGMGLAPGGRMKQDIYDDPYGLDAWDQRQASRCFVSIVNTVQWLGSARGRAPREGPPPGRPADGRSLQPLRPALVRLLRCRPAGACRQQQAEGSQERRRTHCGAGKSAPARQRNGRRSARRRPRQTARPPGARSRRRGSGVTAGPAARLP